MEMNPPRSSLQDSFTAVITDSIKAAIRIDTSPQPASGLIGCKPPMPRPSIVRVNPAKSSQPGTNNKYSSSRFPSFVRSSVRTYRAKGTNRFSTRTRLPNQLTGRLSSSSIQPCRNRNIARRFKEIVATKKSVNATGAPSSSNPIGPMKIKVINTVTSVGRTNAIPPKRATFHRQPLVMGRQSRNSVSKIEVN